MKEKRREAEGRIFSYKDGLGTVTRHMINERAREIALIDGRRSRPTKEDRLQAREELLGMGGLRSEADETDEDRESLDPSDVPASHGRQAETIEPEDEEQLPYELVEHGVEEADHEHMLEGHYVGEEEEEEAADDDAPGRRSGKRGKTS